MEPIKTGLNSQVVRYKAHESSSSVQSELSRLKFSDTPQFVSPKGSVDPQSGVYIVQFRSASTGNVDFQYPNKKVVAEYSRSEKLSVPSSSEGHSPPRSSFSFEPSQGASTSAPIPSSHVSGGTAELGTTNND